MFPNAGKTDISDGSSFWGPSAKIWTPPRDIERRDIHLVDWDGGKSTRQLRDTSTS